MREHTLSHEPCPLPSLLLPQRRPGQRSGAPGVSGCHSWQIAAPRSPEFLCPRPRPRPRRARAHARPTAAAAAVAAPRRCAGECRGENIAAKTQLATFTSAGTTLHNAVNASSASAPARTAFWRRTRGAASRASRPNAQLCPDKSRNAIRCRYQYHQTLSLRPRNANLVVRAQ